MTGTRQRKNVLIFPCGSEVGLEINRSLKYSKDFVLFGGSSVDDHGRFAFNNYLPNLPFVDDDGFIEKINEVVEKYKIDYIFPAHDSVVLKLAQNEAKLKAEVVSSPLETCEIARSKRRTYEKLGGTVRVPEILSPNGNLTFPVFMKPDVGQGSKGAFKANNTAEVTALLNNDNQLLTLEYLPGSECTVDCFTNRHGQLMFTQPRTRERIVNGISVKSKAFDDPNITAIAERINSTLTFKGVWFFQLKKDRQDYHVLLEIAPRVAGTMAVSRMIGANLPLLSLYDRMGIDVSILPNSFQVEIDRALASKFQLGIEYDQVFVDFDDTVIINGQVNDQLMAFLYRCRNANKKVVLITKHIEEIRETLLGYHISESLFDEIISLSKLEEKASHINGRAIFIDDSFTERKAVLEIANIPVFDTSEAVEL